MPSPDEWWIFQMHPLFGLDQWVNHFHPQGYSLPVGEMEAHGLDVHQVLFQHILTVMLEVSLS